MNSQTKEKWLTATEVVDLLWGRIADGDEERRAVAARIRKRLAYALDNDRLPKRVATSGLKDQRFKSDDVWRFAKENWPNRFWDVAASRVFSDNATAHARLSDTLTDRVLPGSLDRCQQAMREALDRVDVLEAELHQTRTRLVELERLAEKNRKFRDRRRASVFSSIRESAHHGFRRSRCSANCCSETSFIGKRS